MANGKRKKWLVVSLVVIALICTGAFFWFQIQEEDTPILIASTNGLSLKQT